MNRRALIPIVIAILAAVLIGAVWLIFFHSAGTAPAQNGAFGTSGNRGTGATGTSTNANMPGNVLPNGGQNASSGGGGIQIGPGGTVTSVTVVPNPGYPSGNWLAGGGTGGVSGGSGGFFTPIPTNQLNNGQVGGQVNVFGSYPTDGGGNGTGIAIGVIGATAVSCAVFLAPGTGSVPTVPPSVSVQNPQQNNKTFMDCLMRTIVRAALQQMTASIVNWINSGFNGKPSFIQDYRSFFAGVADQAAGTFISNFTNFAPFCTPFQKQIQIALAQSYARNNSMTAPSCTLTQLLGTNIFAGGKPSFAGGWGSLVSFTTNTSNNPFGAYLTAQTNLYNSQQQALINANRNISPGGFLSSQQPYNCRPSPTGGQPICQYRTTTPGSVVESSLAKTLGVSQDTLTQAGISGSFDTIIGALLSQLMNKALYSGLSTLSGENGYGSEYLTPDQQAAQEQGQALLTNLQNYVVLAQQYGQAKQGSIQDIQSAQQNLNNLANCWQTAASSSGELSDQQRAAAASSAQNALNVLHQYDSLIISLNDQITKANSAISVLQDLQTKVLNVTSTDDVKVVQDALDEALAQGVILTQNDVTQAQQDRTSLQAELSTRNISTQTELKQCYDFH